MNNGDSIQTAEPRSSAVHLRMLERLRSGLPPSEAINELCVDFDRPLTTMHKVLLRPAESRRWLVVHGQYGGGKTHFLQVMRSEAHRNGYATCYLCSDGYASALNHPQRFLHVLLGTMEVSGRPGVGYDHLISQCLATPQGRDWLTGAVNRCSVGFRQPFVTALNLLASLDYSTPSARPEPYFVSEIIEQLSGGTMVYRGATPSAREVVYHLLRLACEVIRHAGGRGLVLLIDEVESVFTKMPSARSRSGAMRVLSALCETPELPDVVTALALTPDAVAQLQNESPAYDRYGCLHSLEPLDDFLGHFCEVEYIVECRLPGTRMRQSLLGKVRTAYQHAYPKAGIGGPDGSAAWKRMVMAKSDGLSMRLLVREAVDLLDTERFSSQSSADNQSCPDAATLDGSGR